MNKMAHGKTLTLDKVPIFGYTFHSIVVSMQMTKLPIWEIIILPGNLVVCSGSLFYAEKNLL